MYYLDLQGPLQQENFILKHQVNSANTDKKKAESEAQKREQLMNHQFHCMQMTYMQEIDLRRKVENEFN